MQFPFPFIDVLTLPTDATSTTRRIVLDGINVEIDLYDASGDKRIQIGGSAAADEDSIQFYSGDTDESEPGRIHAAVQAGTPALVLKGPTVTNQFNNAYVQLEAPPNDPATDRPVVAIYSDNSDVDLYLQLKRLIILQGSNTPAGRTTLVAGTRTINNDTITANTLIFLSRETVGGTLGHLSSTRIAGTSFTINSSSATDTSTIVYFLIQPLP